MRCAPWVAAALAVCPALAGCRGSMVQEYYVPTGGMTAQGAPGTTLVRTTAHGPSWALDCLAQNHALGQSACALQGQVASQNLAVREAQLAAQLAMTHTAGQELASVVGAAGTSGLSADERLRALNVVGAGLGAPQPFRSVAEAQAYLQLVAQGGAR